jgi:hypothetical protein
MSEFLYPDRINGYSITALYPSNDHFFGISQSVIVDAPPLMDEANIYSNGYIRTIRNTDNTIQLNPRNR